jgi:hypothetical protein
VSEACEEPVTEPVVCLQDGVYVKGLFLQGAGWDKKNSCLVEAEPMQLVCPIPTIHFKPVESRRRSQRGKACNPGYEGDHETDGFFVAVEYFVLFFKDCAWILEDLISSLYRVLYLRWFDGFEIRARY